jgi:hypothetical protein
MRLFGFVAKDSGADGERVHSERLCGAESCFAMPQRNATSIIIMIVKRNEELRNAA